MKLNWDNLRVFLAVARCHSALEAAVHLQLDHSTITRRLRRLEKEIGSKVFDRTSQGHVLTETGHRLLDYVKQVESMLTLMESELGGDSQLPRGHVRLGATEGFGSFFVAPHLAEFAACHPGISVDLLAVPRFVNLSKREADIAISIERPQSGSYTVCKLTDYRLRLYATRRYLAAHPAICTPADLLGHRLVGYVDELAFSSELHYLNKCAPGAAVPIRSTSVIAQFMAVRRGHGLAILPCFIGNTCPELLPVLPGVIDVVRSFWLIAPSERREIARVRTLWNFLRSVSEQNQAFLMGETGEMCWTMESTVVC